MTNSTTLSSAAAGAIPCKITLPRHLHIGGGDPYICPEDSYYAIYRKGAVLTPRVDDNGRTLWECCFTVEGSPVLVAGKPIKRYMTNHGTYAARVGGAPVIIERSNATPEEMLAHREMRRKRIFQGLAASVARNAVLRTGNA